VKSFPDLEIYGLVSLLFLMMQHIRHGLTTSEMCVDCCFMRTVL